MARLGLGRHWRCVFANDICPKKAEAYRTNFPPADELLLADVGALHTSDLPGKADLSWASFPCQDLSLAGERRGLAGAKSGTFHGFWRLMEGLVAEGRAPRTIVLENVTGAISSNHGRDLQCILQSLASSGYRGGAMVVDGALFVPQSRPRLFIVAVHGSLKAPAALTANGPTGTWHTKAIQTAYNGLPQALRGTWCWWSIPQPPARQTRLEDVLEEQPNVQWHTAAQTQSLLNMMSPVNRQKVEQAIQAGGRRVGGVYRRTREVGGVRVQRAELRVDGLSGCLRTPGGGSSRQTILEIGGHGIRSRLLSPREAARLMGVADDYRLPDNYNEAYGLMGDGLVVPAVSWLEANLIRPLLDYSSSGS